MNGPNACNASFLCQSDPVVASVMVGPCRGASPPYQYYCALNNVAGTAGPAAVSAPSSAAALVPAPLPAAAGGLLLLLLASGPRLF